MLAFILVGMVAAQRVALAQGEGRLGPVRALLSCSDKTGIAELARGLAELGYELVSTGGTADALSTAGIPVTSVAEVTGFPEILDGRVKTLHPAIHGAILARADDSRHRDQLAQYGFAPITLVAVNLYPFERTVGKADVDLNTAIEEIDIGGPAMLRAAAKNHASVVVLTNPADYQDVLDKLRADALDAEVRRRLAAKAFAHVATYDSLVAAFLAKGEDASPFPDELPVGLRRARTLRYGENPHQRAAAYHRVLPGERITSILDADQLAGKELSFNNLLDADAAWQAAGIASEPTVAIVKHTIPCGLATRDEIMAAFKAALAGDPVSAFGGIVALNRPVDVETALTMSQTRFDIIIAPGYDGTALAHLRNRRSLRLLRLPNFPLGTNDGAEVDLRPIQGGVLVQTADVVMDDPSEWQVVTERAPTAAERDDLTYAWQAIRLIKSNAIALAKGRALVGVGSGQPNRLESVEIAAGKAGAHAAGCALASDAFFPFVDGVEAAARHGVRAIVQPGGSVRDGEVITAANDAGVAMLFTGVRHFRH